MKYRKKMPLLPYANAVCFGLPFGWFFGRMGCFVVHDHPGRVVAPETFGAMPWGCVCRDGNPSGLNDLWVRSECCVNEVWRYDLGLMEFMFLVGLCLFVYLVYDWRNAAPGKITVNVQGHRLQFTASAYDAADSRVYEAGDTVVVVEIDQGVARIAALDVFG